MAHIGPQTHCNIVSEEPPPKRRNVGSSSKSAIVEGRNNAWHNNHTMADELPTHSNRVDATDGYRREAMLFVDEDAINATPMRSSGIGALVWRPFVRFQSTHYKFETVGSENRIVQVGIGVDDSAPRRHLNGEPPSATVERAVATRIGA